MLQAGGGLEKNFSDYKLVDSDGKTELTADQLLDNYFFYDNAIDDCFVKHYLEEATEEDLKVEAIRKNIFYQQQVVMKHLCNNDDIFLFSPCYKSTDILKGTGGKKSEIAVVILPTVVENK